MGRGRVSACFDPAKADQYLTNLVLSVLVTANWATWRGRTSGFSSLNGPTSTRPVALHLSPNRDQRVTL